MTPQRIASFKSRIYSLQKIGLNKTAEKVKKEALKDIAAANQDGQWIADRWFGSCSQKTIDDVIKFLSSED